MQNKFYFSNIPLHDPTNLMINTYFNKLSILVNNFSKEEHNKNIKSDDSKLNNISNVIEMSKFKLKQVELKEDAYKENPIDSNPIASKRSGKNLEDIIEGSDPTKLKKVFNSDNKFLSFDLRSYDFSLKSRLIYIVKKSF